MFSSNDSHFDLHFHFIHLFTIIYFEKGELNIYETIIYYFREGLTDLFEFLTLIEYNHARIDKVVYFHTPQSDKQLSSVAIIMNPTTGKQFQAIYMMLNAFKISLPK